MRRGFTLIELLGVIVILGVLSVLIVPVVNNMMIESREDLAAAQEKSILKAAKNWGNANIFMLPDCDGAPTCDETITITLGQLMNEGFLDNQTIKDVNKNKIYSTSTEIVIGKNNNQNTYKIETNIYEEEVVAEEGAPSIILSGSSTIVEEVSREGSALYKEPGITVKDKEGNDLGYTVTVTKVAEQGVNIDAPEEILSATKNAGIGNVAGSYDFGFDTKTVANYKIVYEAELNGKKATMIRNVQVRDTTAPTINFVNSISVSQSFAHQYSDETTLKSNVKYIEPDVSTSAANEERNKLLLKIANVVIIDNSCGKDDIDLKVESEVPTEKTPGTYFITYTATDKYGNKTKKIRNVKIVAD